MSKKKVDFFSVKFIFRSNYKKKKREKKNPDILIFWVVPACHNSQKANHSRHSLANLPPGAVNVGADQLDDITRLDAECRTNGGTGYAIVVPDDQHLWQTCGMEDWL